ncbi:MAG: phosphotransferase [Deltaproteobacteria bacterium]|nr:phosphotransferase [Deltaproteobacteria bacterium]
MKNIGEIVNNLKFFFNDIRNIHEIPVGNINRTFVVTLSRKCSDQRDHKPFPRKFVAQLINSKVFTIKAVERNLTAFSSLVNTNQSLNEIIPKYLVYDKKVVSCDNKGNAWKFTEFIEKARCGEFPKSETESYLAARSLAIFHRELSKINIRSFRYSIPNFFVPQIRVKQFFNALKRGNSRRVANVSRHLDQIFCIKEKLEKPIIMMTKQQKFLCHNDTKFENFLIVEKKAYIIDHDVLQPGVIAYDIGDFLRTVCFLENEDKQSEPDIKVDFLRSASEGLNVLSYERCFGVDRELIKLSPAILSFILALRFLTDYLLGDRYFKIKYEDQNLKRGVCQLRRSEILYENRDQIRIR